MSQSLFDCFASAYRAWLLAPAADALSRLESQMSALSDKIAEVNQHVDDAVARVTTDLAALNAKIADLQAAVDAGGATPEDLAALDALKAKVDALDPTPPPAPPAS